MYDRSDIQNIKIEDNVSKRVNLTIPDVVYEELEAWAEYQGRPTANLAAYLVESAIREAKDIGEYRTLRKKHDENHDRNPSYSREKGDK